MNINNLVFFDREGQSYNFSQDESGTWIGADYFQPVSTALYDVSNLFILEKTESGYRFPVMESGSTISMVWQSAQSSTQLFLFTVSLEDPADSSTAYISPQSQITINYSDFPGTGGTPLNLTYPLQINVGFSPTEEIGYSRNLLIYYTTGSGTNLIANISFYGEGEDEDERFRVWLANFGVKFNREDALLLKDYDLKESLPDWKQINQARKQILVNRDQIYPYVGTYKGMINLIDILGYRDVLRVKEYWKDSDLKSSYYGKYAMVDVTDLMTQGAIDSIDLVDLNGQIKKGGKFVKTEFLALVYEFSVASDNYDDDGLPEVVFTTEFEVDEIFYKLNRLATKLKTEMLPVNVVIKDIIGEFIYFEKFNIRYWQDKVEISAFEINDRYLVNLNSPNTKALELLIRDIKTLYPKTGDSLFPVIEFNTTTTDPYSNAQAYPISDIPQLITAIVDYYNNLRNYEFFSHGADNPMKVGDEAGDKIGCPVCLEAYIPDFMLSELDGSKFGDFTNSHYTIGNVRYRDGYEIEWNITGPQGYTFNRRGILSDLVKIPHILPHTGDFIIQSTVYDLHGEANTAFRTITVIPDLPNLEVFTRLQDKRVYTIKDMANLTIGDVASSPLYLPFANATQVGGNSVLPPHYFDYYTYINNFGVGGQQDQVQIFTEGVGFEPVPDSLNELKLQWGTGSGYKGQTTLKDISTATIGDLLMNRLWEFSYYPSRTNGFYIDLADFSDRLYSINFSNIEGNEYFFPNTPGLTVDDYVSILNSETNSQVAAYKYANINGKIHAEATIPTKQLNRILTVIDITEQYKYIYTFCYPSEVYSYDLISRLNIQLQQIYRKIDDDLLFLDAPFNDCLKPIGETVYSNTIVIDPYQPIIEFTLSRAHIFSDTYYIKVVSLRNPDAWVSGTIASQMDPYHMELTVEDYSPEFETASAEYTDWSFTYEELPGFTNTAPAGDPQYWIQKGFIEFEDSASPDFLITGFIPSNYDQNAFTINNTKIGLDALTIPLYHPLVVAVSNVDSKATCEWTLYAYDQELVKIKSNSYFIWRFDEPGEYNLKVTVTDFRQNIHTLSTPVKVSHAKSQKDYELYVNRVLDARKAKIQSKI